MVPTQIPHPIRRDARCDSPDRLDSWKAIAVYLKRDVRTVQRWERTEGLPVKRHLHQTQYTVYAFGVEIEAWMRGRRAPNESPATCPMPARSRRHLAVLPFEDWCGDPEQEYFSDGLMEEVLVQLGRLRPEPLGVIGRATMMQYKSTQKSIGEIGRELGVDYLLQGSVRRADRHIRISAQLLRVSDQTQMWADSYKRSLKDALAIQIDVAERIARSVVIEELPDHHTHFLARPARMQPHTIPTCWTSEVANGARRHQSMSSCRRGWIQGKGLVT